MNLFQVEGFSYEILSTDLRVSAFGMFSINYNLFERVRVDAHHDGIHDLYVMVVLTKRDLVMKRIPLTFDVISIPDCICDHLVGFTFHSNIAEVQERKDFRVITSIKCKTTQKLC
jgi:hypothetical protein